MNSELQRAILMVGSSWAVATIAKATLIMTLGLWATRLAGRQRAAVRHAMLAATFGILLALPMVSALAPPIGIALRSGEVRGPSRPNALPPSPGRLPKRSAAIRPAPEPSRWSVPTLLSIVWLAGAALFLLQMAFGLRQVLRFRWSGLPWRQGQTIAHGLALGAGVRPRVDVLLHEDLAGPMTCGVVRPAIVLPADAPNWDTEDLHRALMHELEHVNRRDWATHIVARVVCAIYWFHPLAWMAWRRLGLEAERACDDAVLQQSEPTAYADQLVTIAQRLSSAAKSPLPAMANRSDLASRVNAVLDGCQRRGRAGTLWVTAATAAAMALVLTVSPLRIVAAPQAAGGAGKAMLRAETKMVIVPVTVTFPNGNTVEGLSASDFELTEEGVPQALQFCEFHKAEEAGLNSQYILGFYPRNTAADGLYRKIKILVKTASSALLQYRSGYYMNETMVGVARIGSGPGSDEGAAPPPYDTPPVLIFKREPAYSDEARKARYQGTVLLNVEIDDSGKVVQEQVVRTLGLGLDEKAIEAVQQWRFKPATKNGRPVGAQTQVEVSFRLL